MPTESDPKPWESLEQIAKTGDAQQLEQFLHSLPAGEAVRAISRLGSDKQNKVLTTLEPHQAAGLIEECPQAEARDLMEQLPRTDAAAILLEMNSDDQADLITSLSAEDAEAILREMPAEEAAEARKLASYAPDEAGGLMVTEFLSFPEIMMAGQVFDDLRTNASTYADYDVQYVYCVSPFGELVGVLRLRDLLLTHRDKPISDFMIRKPLSVHLHTPLDELSGILNDHTFFGVPVVDEGGRLVGIVKRRDVEHAINRLAESNYLKFAGIVGGDELRTMPLRVRSARRLSWLSLNIVLNIFAASIIAFYQGTLEKVIALAVFLPIISDMSGCAGNQAVAVSMREMALGMIKPVEVMRVWLKEVVLGTINGIVLGVLIALVALWWQGNVYLGLVVGAALALNTVVAVSIGGTVPLVLKLMKKDPALASGPILTTVTDMCGFFFVLSFASAMLAKLT